jgi:hypothetical protein
MKKICLLIILVFAITGLKAQSTRLSLIEEATNASCGPCASQNPGFDALLDQNRDIITAIKYHWYYPGTDPMNAQNPVENNGRVAYYGINGVPTAAIDGVIPDGSSFGYPGSPAGYTQAVLDQYSAVPSPFNIWISHRISADQDSIYIDMMIQATETVYGSLVAHMVVVEKHINFTSPPGTNGEKNFHDVMRKMVPDNNGTALPGAFMPGDYMIIQGAWKMQNIYNIAEVGVVGFVQDNGSKTVHQAANSTTDPLTPLYANEMNVAGVKGISETNCLGTLAPRVILRNQGSDVLTSTDIYYHINNEDVYTYHWTGNLAFMQSTEVQLPEFSFELQDQNNFYAISTDPNGIPDEYLRNDTLVQPFDRAMITPLTVKLMIRTDANPTQTTWEVLNSAGAVMYSGGPYSNGNTVYSSTFQLGDVECYKFMIYDTGGDGLVVPGFYALYYGNGTYIKNGTAYGYADSAYFEVNTQVGIPDREPELNVGIYPNPATTSVNVDFVLIDNQEVSINIYDLSGRNVMNNEPGTLSPGDHQIRIKTEGLEPGIYLIRAQIGQKTFNQKLTINHF